MKCPCCDKNNSIEKYSGIVGLDNNIYSIIECEFCMFSTLSPMPKSSDLTDYYTKTYNGRTKTNIFEYSNSSDFIKTNESVFEDMSARLMDIERIADLAQGQKNLVRLLDVGCGYGQMLYSAAMRGGKYSAKGIDLDSESITYGKDKLGLDLEIGTVYDIKDKFDLVTQWMVLEHTLNPGDQVKAIRDCLNNNGIYAGSVPNMGGWYAKLKGKYWYNIIPPEHINYFNNNNLTMILERNGFRILFLGTIPRYASPSINFGIRKKLNNIISRVRIQLLKRILLSFYRFLTIIKRVFVYKLLNFIIVKFDLGGNGIFWVVQKIK